MPKDNLLSHEDVLRLFSYDETTGIFTNRVFRNSRSPIGSQAGYVRGGKRNGYIVIRVGDVDYLAHRLAWFYVYGVWPEHIIEHKDLVRTNNRLDNLRPANQSQNMSNTNLRSTNTLGVKGVYHHKTKGVYQARICVQYKKKSLGYYSTLQEAADAYDKAALEYFGEYALTNKMIRERELESGRSNQ